MQKLHEIKCVSVILFNAYSIPYDKPAAKTGYKDMGNQLLERELPVV